MSRCEPLSGRSACPGFHVYVVLFDPRESWGRVNSDLSSFWLGRKTANFTDAVSWSTTSITQERLLTVVNNSIYSLYNDFFKSHVQQQGVLVRR